MREASKPSRTPKQDLENMDAFASSWGKDNGGKKLLRDLGIEASSIEYSQHHDISQISSEDTFLFYVYLSILLTPLGKLEKTLTNRTLDSWRGCVNIDQCTVWKEIPSGCEEFC